MAKKNPYSVGNAVRLLANNAAGLTMGFEGKITTYRNSQVQIDTYPGYWFHITQVEVILSTLTKAELEEKKTEAEEEAKELQSKLDYLAAFSIEVFDENEYKVYTALKAIDDKKITEQERVKLIAKLIK